MVELMLWLVVVLMAVAFLSWIFLVSPSQKRKAPRRPILHIDVPSFGTMRSLEPEDFDEAALCMALAFCDSPWYTFIFQDQKERQERIKALCFLFTRNMSLMYQKDPHALLGLRDGSGFVCCFILANPKVRQVSKLELVQSGILKLAWYFGVGAMMRISSVVDFLGEAERAVVANAMQGWQLQRMVVAPRMQGKGVGSACLAAALKSRVTRGDLVVLSTNEERNVTFYKRLGFEVCGDIAFAPEKLGRVPYWHLKMVPNK